MAILTAKVHATIDTSASSRSDEIYKFYYVSFHPTKVGFCAVEETTLEVELAAQTAQLIALLFAAYHQGKV